MSALVQTGVFSRQELNLDSKRHTKWCLFWPFWRLQRSLWWFWECCSFRQSPYRWRAPLHKSLWWTNRDLKVHKRGRVKWGQFKVCLTEQVNWVNRWNSLIMKWHNGRTSLSRTFVRHRRVFMYLPGKGCRETISSGRPSSLPSALTSSLWKSFSGSITFPCRITKEWNQHCNSERVGDMLRYCTVVRSKTTETQNDIWALNSK